MRVMTTVVLVALLAAGCTNQLASRHRALEQQIAAQSDGWDRYAAGMSALQEDLSDFRFNLTNDQLAKWDSYLRNQNRESASAFYGSLGDEQRSRFQLLGQTTGELQQARATLEKNHEAIEREGASLLEAYEERHTRSVGVLSALNAGVNAWTQSQAGYVDRLNQLNTVNELRTINYNLFLQNLHAGN